MAGLGDAFAPIQGAFNQASNQAASSGGGLGIGAIVFICFIIGAAIITVGGVWFWFHFSEKKAWNIVTRVHYENPNIAGVSIGSPVPTKRMRFKDGKVVYIYKTPIQGYTVSPELLIWTRPREHDVIVTQDKRLFCLVGINSIDVQRKKLNVDIAYPDIEMDRQDLQQFIDSKRIDNPNDRLKMILKAAGYIFLMVTIIVLAVLGGKYYIQGKNIDAGRDQANLKTAEYQAMTMEQVNTFLLILSKTMPESFKQIDNKNLLEDIKNG